MTEKTLMVKRAQTLIAKVFNVNSEGVSLELTQPACLDRGMAAKQWRVSWDAIGKALFKEQYLDCDMSVADLKIERGE